ncbi:hypothetical protein ACIRU3_40915 [Streptomyces sp. NPDC101151]|uniref:hypothetical protein n=1 Tax=Streptomyces sp. NPDC101151 TaxID=3366115 RepID=UPI003808CECE
MWMPMAGRVLTGSVVGLAIGALLIEGSHRYEELVLGRGTTLLVLTTLGIGTVLGLAAWAAADTENSALGWLLAGVFCVHAFVGSFGASDQALHDRGVQVTATVQKEHTIESSNEVGYISTYYEYDLAVPLKGPHRQRLWPSHRLAVGDRVLVTVDPEDHAAPVLGPRPEINQAAIGTLRVCDALFVLISLGLSIFLSLLLIPPRSRLAA